MSLQGHGRPSSHKPELILNNFDTRLGHRVGRMFASLFCQDPTFRGRRAVTFHNQRDFIFFRCLMRRAPAQPLDRSRPSLQFLGGWALGGTGLCSGLLVGKLLPEGR